MVCVSADFLWSLSSFVLDDDESVGSLDDGKMNRKRSKGSNNPNSPDVSVGMSSTVLPDVMTLSTSLDINTDGKKKQTESEFIEEVRKNQRRTTINLGKSHSEDIWAKNHGFKGNGKQCFAV